MTVQRYVFRYKPHQTEADLLLWYQKYGKPGCNAAELAQADARHHMTLYGSHPYEKEGGGLTNELSEAKLIGWRSAKKWRDRYSRLGVLLPARIVLEEVKP